MRSKFFLVSLMCLWGVQSAFAAHPLVSDDAGTIGKGTIQIELNADISTDKETDGGITTKTEGSQISSTFGYGLTEKLDATFGIVRPWGTLEENGLKSNDPGSVDYSFGLKYQVYERDGLAMAIKPALTYSSSVNSPDDASNTSYSVAAVLSKDMEPLSFHLNLGYSYTDFNNSDGRNSIWSISGATIYNLNKATKLVADLGSSSNPERGINDMPAFILLGAIYSVNKNIDFSAGGKIGLTKPEDDFTGTFGLTFKF